MKPSVELTSSDYLLIVMYLVFPTITCKRTLPVSSKKTSANTFRLFLFSAIRVISPANASLSIRSSMFAPLGTAFVIFNSS